MTTKQAGVDWPSVLKMLAGGAFVGTGIGAGTSLINQLGNLRQESAPEPEDKNTLYLNLPPRPAPAKSRRIKNASDQNSAATFALSGAGAIAGTYMAYNVIRNAYQNARKRQLAKELDSAHNVYLGKLSDSAELGKSASQFPALSRGVGAAYLALLLTGVGSGIVANKVLNKQFPTIKEPERFGPKRIVIRSKAPDDDTSPGEDKEANTDEIEGLLRYHMADEKRAAVSGFADLVAAAAQGRCQEIQDNIEDVDTLMDLVKGASYDSVDPWKKNLAITWLAADPEISETLAPVLASEFADSCPGLFKLACYITPKVGRKLTGLVKAAVAQTRQAVYVDTWKHVKKAETMFDRFIPEPAENLLLANFLKEMLTDKEKDAPAKPSSAVVQSPEVGQTQETPVQAEDDQAARFLMKHKDDLEKALTTATV